MTTQMQHAPRDLKSIVRSEKVIGRFEEVLGKTRAPQYMASILSLQNATPALQSADPVSIIAAAMTAATLDLPVNKDLGFAWIIPYRDNKAKKTVAQFQLGYKGFIQLAQRSGQFARMNASPVNAEAFSGFDEIGEPVIDWTKLDLEKPAVGYAFGFRLVNHFQKLEYWTRERVQSHAKRYSRSHSSGPWRDDFDAMALKTVCKLTLSRWAPLSVQMQSAQQFDQQVYDGDKDGDYRDNPKTADARVIETDSTGRRQEFARPRPGNEPPPQIPSQQQPPPQAAPPAPAPETAPEPIREPPPENAGNAPQTASAPEASPTPANGDNGDRIAQEAARLANSQRINTDAFVKLVGEAVGEMDAECYLKAHNQLRGATATIRHLDANQKRQILDNLDGFASTVREWKAAQASEGAAQ